MTLENLFDTFFNEVVQSLQCDNLLSVDDDDDREFRQEQHPGSTCVSVQILDVGGQRFVSIPHS